MTIAKRQLDTSEEIEAAEKAADVAAEALVAAREQLRKAAEAFWQAQHNLAKVQEKHGIPVPDWPEHSVADRRWWATE